MKIHRTGTVAALVLIIAIGLFFRLTSIRTYSPNPDEFHWVSRSEKIASRYEQGDIDRLTNHLGHPGIPPAVGMAIAEALADSWNEFIGAARGSRKYIDHLSAARLSNVCWFLLAIPLVFTSFRRAIGDAAALLAAALISFDTQHIANTRIAHIDGALTTLVLCCVALYMESQVRRSLYLKLLAGVAWGLCLSVKPTAISLLPSFLLINAIWHISADRSGNKEDRVPIVAWSDLLTALIGLLTLATLHTRFWDPNSKFVRVHHINPWICDQIKTLGGILAGIPGLVLAIAIITLILSAYCLRLGRDRSTASSRLRGTILPLIITAGILLMLIGWFPTIINNLVRYFYWILGLSHTAHHAYGVVVDPPPGGYPKIWLAKAAPWTVLGAMIATLWTIIALIAKQRWSWINKHRELVGYVVIALIWTAFLNVSPKQAFRYILPVLPFVAAFSAFGLMNLWGVLSRGQRVVPAICIVLMFALPQLIPTIAVSPDFELYFSSYTGGLSGATAAGASIAPTHYEQAFAEIEKIAIAQNKVQLLEVAGDYDLLQTSYRRAYLPADRHLKLIPYQDGLGSDWLISFPSFVSHKIRNFNKMENLTLQSEQKLGNGIIYQLYRVNPLQKNREVRIDLSTTARETGKLFRAPTSDYSALELDADSDRAGFGVFGVFLKLPAGKTTFKVVAALHELRPANGELILKLALSTCQVELRLAEFGATPKIDEYQPFEVSCEFKENNRLQPTVYWFANQSVLIKDLSVETH